jgi:hypothetical protein
LAIGRPSLAQVFDVEKERSQIAELHGLWHFHTGDDPQWSDPDFDDSQWQLLRSDQSWSDQGYKNYGGMAWYRFRLILPATHAPFAVYVPELQTSYQVFANGRLIGQWGGLPPHEKDMTGSGNAKERQIIPIPDDLVPPSGAVTLAIRVWLREDRAFRPGGPRSAISVGEVNRLAEWKTLQLRDAFWSVNAQNVLLLGYVLAGLAGLGLFALRRTELEYLWFAAMELFSAAYCGWVGIYPAFFVSSYQFYYSILGALLFAYAGCFLMFAVTLLKERRGLLFWTTMASVTILGLAFVPAAMAWMSAKHWIVLFYPDQILFTFCLLFMIYRAARRGNRDARLLLAPVALSLGGNLAKNLINLLYISGHVRYAVFYQISERLVSWPFPISFQEIADFLTQLSILAILVLRFARARGDEQRMASELEAARTVQSVLIPTEVPGIPEFAIASVYRPATQVGGDFFQIIPAANGGVLIVIGDVSGKGMPAAMTVSLLVGTIRTLAHYTQSPSEMLAAMNARMLTRSAGGFTTCLVLRADRDGSLTVANAGHIAPVLNGKELVLQIELPLGLSAGSAYVESTFHIGLGEQLTLMTDGVVEARNEDGELFGFERAAAMASGSAESIAGEARAFGQEDDITVLTVSRIGPRHNVQQDAAGPALSPSHARGT